MQNETGSSLIEILTAVVLLVGSAVYLAMIYPKAVRSSATTSQRLFAQQLAASKLNDIKKNPFDYIPVTQPGVPGGLPAAILNCNCDDPLIDYTTLSSSYTTLSGTMYYTVAWCVNETSPTGPVNNLWTAACPVGATATKAYKNIHVRVSWNKNTSAINETAIASRY